MGEDHMQAFGQDQQQGNMVFADPIGSQITEKGIDLSGILATLQ